MNFNKIIPHVAAFLICFIAMVMYFSPIVLDNKTLPQGDVQQAQGMQTEIMEHYKQTGQYPKWTNQMFIGMPSYQIYGAQQSNWIDNLVSNIIFVGNKYNVTDPHVLFFWLMIFAYVGLLLFDIPAWVALGVALSFGFMTNNSVLLEAGHCNKVFAMLYTLPILGAAWQTLNGRWLLGGATFAFFTALQVGASHVQITYYTFFIVGFMVVGKLFFDNTNIKDFPKSIAALALATVLGIGANLTSLWTTYEYAEESIRGKSELADATNNGGLSKSYIYGWSFGKMETFTLFVPHFYGGSSSESWAADRATNTAKYLGTLPPELGQNLSGLTGKYWGTQPFTSGPVYWGAAFFFLAVLGLCTAPKSIRLALGAALALFIMLSWGKNFAGFNDLMIDYFPFYNKFRAVTMTLTVAQAMIAILAAFAAKHVWDIHTQAETNPDLQTKSFAHFEKQLYTAASIALGLTTFVLLYSFMGSFESENVMNVINEQQKENPQIVPVLQALEAAMEKDRASLMRADALKSLLVIGLSAAMLWAFARRKLSATVALVTIAAVSLLDLYLVDNIYLHDDKNPQKSSFKPRKEVFGKPAPIAADAQIKQDKDLHYRVLDFARGSVMNSAQTAYHHRSVGGYHAAKPMLFQELVERYGISPQAIQQYPQVFEMLNTKYVIMNAPNQPNPVAMPLQTALGNAWFVSNISWVDNANQELDSLATFFPNTTAIIQKKFESYLQNFNNTNGANDKIYLTAYQPEVLTYKSSTQGERLAVFSEIYYPPHKGWNVYIDDKLSQSAFIKVNYLLRGLRVPAGEHTITFKFEPRAVAVGETVALFSSLTVLVLLGASLYLAFKKKEA
jgi:hypothetical protein